jgi:hypothetical protein
MISKFHIPLKFYFQIRGFDGQVHGIKAQGLLDLLSRAINCPEREKGNALKVSRALRSD